MSHWPMFLGIALAPAFVYLVLWIVRPVERFIYTRTRDSFLKRLLFLRW